MWMVVTIAIHYSEDVLPSITQTVSRPLIKVWLDVKLYPVTVNHSGRTGIWWKSHCKLFDYVTTVQVLMCDQQLSDYRRLLPPTNRNLIY